MATPQPPRKGPLAGDLPFDLNLPVKVSEWLWQDLGFLATTLKLFVEAVAAFAEQSSPRQIDDRALMRLFFESTLRALILHHISETEIATWNRERYQTDFRDSAPAIPSPGAIEYFHGDNARCLVEIHGRSLPVDLPSEPLQRHGLSEHMRFEWVMTDDTVRFEDIKACPVADLSSAERAELDRLYQEDRADPAADVWDHLHED